MGSPIALVMNGDPVIIDAEKREMTLGISAAEFKQRKQAWKKLAPRYPRGVLAKYAHTVTSAAMDADLNF